MAGICSRTVVQSKARYLPSPISHLPTLVLFGMDAADGAVRT
jgi:hypothetical protein